MQLTKTPIPMAEPHDLEKLFSNSVLEVIVPDGAFDLPQPFSEEGATWLRQLSGQWRARDVAFYGEASSSTCYYSRKLITMASLSIR